ncbi:MAG: ScyD/ScyE family protein [Chloroflexia bacterium]|nr:ScyD/ScyE family protein [Chloroflexia bacterium]
MVRIATITIAGGRLAMVAAAALGSTLGGSATALAQEDGLPPTPAGCEVIAEGLVNPRGIALGDDGTVYVSEAGSGGDEVVTPPGAAEEPSQVATPDPVAAEAIPADSEEGEAGPPLTRGDSGQVTQIAPDGTQSVLASGLASYSEGVGPLGIVFADGQLWVAVGGAGVAFGVEPLETEAAVVRIDPASGEATVVAELAPYEVANNPDGSDINSNLYGMDLGADGRLYVADAGGNSLYAVDPASGEVSLIAVVPTLSGLTDATPAADPLTERQSVPTGVAVGADGAVNVALLSEVWPEDAPNVVRLTGDGTFEPVATGLTGVVDLEAAPDGALYATQIWTGFEGNLPLPGSVERILPDGSAETVLEGIFLPHGLAIADDGTLYLTANSVAFGPEPAGQLLRCAGLTS